MHDIVREIMNNNQHNLGGTGGADSEISSLKGISSGTFMLNSFGNTPNKINYKIYSE